MKQRSNLLCPQVLALATHRRQVAVVRANAAPSARELRVMFLPHFPSEPFLRAELLSGDTALLNQTTKSSAGVEVSYTDAAAKVFFDSTVLHQRWSWFKTTLRLRIPEMVTSVERRNGDRLGIPDDLEFIAHLSLSDARGMREVTGRLLEVSPTGASLLCTSDDALAAIKRDERVPMRLNLYGSELTLLTRHRYTQRLSASSMRVGVEFARRAEHLPALPAELKRLLEELADLHVRRDFRSALYKDFSYASEMTTSNASSPAKIPQGL